MTTKNKRTRHVPIRTASLINTKIIIEPINTQALYQRLSPKAKELRVLGMTFDAQSEYPWSQPQDCSKSMRGQMMHKSMMISYPVLETFG